MTTPFVQSFDNPPTEGRHNFFVRDQELQGTIKESSWLNTPSEQTLQAQETKFGSEEVAKIRQNVEDANRRAKEAMERISSVQLGSTKDRLRLNVQRCISEFGRHNTDKVLPPKPSAVTRDLAMPGSGELTQTKQRIGEDTGSPEVQIAILTARIRSLADGLENGGRQDKRNQRNLRLLVHRRQKQLKYLRRRERAGPRWQNLISTLGLTEGTWKGEITLPRWQVASS